MHDSWIFQWRHFTLDAKPKTPFGWSPRSVYPLSIAVLCRGTPEHFEHMWKLASSPPSLLGMTILTDAAASCWTRVPMFGYAIQIRRDSLRLRNSESSTSLTPGGGV